MPQCLQTLEKEGYNDLFVAIGRMAHSTMLVSISIRPSLRKRTRPSSGSSHSESPGQWVLFSETVISLVSKLHGVDPQSYLADVLNKLVNLWPASRDSATC
jgi:transposase